jgi:hypothetical protein
MEGIKEEDQYHIIKQKKKKKASERDKGKEP